MDEKIEISNHELEDKDKKSLLDDIFDMIESVIFSVFIVVLIFTYLFRISTVDGISMEPTLHNEDKLIISVLGYTPKNEDVIIIDSEALGEYDPVKDKKVNKKIVKRVVAVAGQKVDINFETGKVSVDDKELPEQLFEAEGVELKQHYFVNTLTTQNFGAFEYPITVPEGYIYVMGDNRNNSKDSKHYELGYVPETEVIGKVMFRIYPFNKIGVIK